MSSIYKNIKHLIGFPIIAYTAVIGSILVGCNLKKPDTSVPVGAVSRATGLSAAGIPKSFFIGKDSKGQKPRFLCAWASVNEVSWLSQATLVHNAPFNEHCNMEFDIIGDKLVGKIVNPSFPKDSSRWRIGITIPITKHYYYEKERDAQGRETNRMIENDQRSAPEARPYVNLDLKGLDIKDSGMGVSPDGSTPNIYGIEDEEWDLNTGFLGFTVNIAGKFYYWDQQAQLRVNFLKFKSNEKFMKTPFNDKNYRYLNVLHFVGKQINGDETVLSAAHWDLNKTHKVSLIGFPKEYEAMGAAVIEDWNNALEKVGAIKRGQKPFVVDTASVGKYAFDLRRNSITWIADRNISSRSPLGIAINSADVVTGEMLWGGITIYGGMLEDYVRRTMPSSNPVEDGRIFNFQNFIDQKIFNNSRLTLPPQISAIAQTGTVSPSNMTATLQNLNYRMAMIYKNVPGLGNIDVDTTLANTAFKFDPSNLPTSIFNQLVTASIGVGQGSQSASQIINDFRTNILNQFNSLNPNRKSTMSAKSASEFDETKPFTAFHSHSIHCLDNTFDKIGNGWSDARATYNISYEDAVKSVVTYLISHEYGHFMGLGHQFKENILPKKGTVPDYIYEPLEAKAKKNMTNSTSVMGYPNPETEILTPPQEIKPGPQDLLGLRFLYKREYPVFKTGDADFTYITLRPDGDGIIPPHDPSNTTRKTSYFPQCSDITASYNLDPFCNRFDRGYDAETLMKGYFNNINNSLINYLISFSDLTNGNPTGRAYRLTIRSLTDFGRIRLFYDYMRSRYSDFFAKLAKEPKLIFEFDEICSSKDLKGLPDSSSETLRILQANPELLSLCRANAFALKEIESIVSMKVSDYTRMNPFNNYIIGGIGGGDYRRDWSHIEGSWEELAAFPLKFSALLALYEINPWMVYSDSWGAGIWNVSNYDFPQFRYTYASFYPKLFTQTVSKVIKNNLFLSKYVGGQSENTTMGLSVFSSAFLSGLIHRSHDNVILQPDYVQQLKGQTQFDLKLVALLVDAETSEGTNKIFKFSGSVYDFASGRSTSTSDVFLLPDGGVIARAAKMYLFPLPHQKLTFYDDKKAYIFAYQVTYSNKFGDDLAGFSTKTELQNAVTRIIDTCLIGEPGKEKNGLSTFFMENTRKGFEGFDLKSGIATNTDHQRTFLKSVNSAFDSYYGRSTNQEQAKPYTDIPNPQTCIEANNSLGLIVSTAGLLNYFWLPELQGYLEN